MQATTCFHDGIPQPILQETNFILDDSVAFHSANGVFNADSNGGNTMIRGFLRGGEFSSRGFSLGLDDRHVLQAESLEALILIQATAKWQGVAGQLGNALISGFPFTGVAQEAHVTALIDHEEVFERVAFLLATVILLLLLWVFRTLDGSFGTIMKKRAVVGPASVRFAASSVAKSSAVRAGSNSWCASA
jgi:hypothetical protein